jgi:hypothetical protein
MFDHVNYSFRRNVKLNMADMSLVMLLIFSYIYPSKLLMY